MFKRHQLTSRNENKWQEIKNPSKKIVAERIFNEMNELEMNKKKLFCTVIADAILRESQFTRRDLKDIVRIFQYNRVVQDPEDPVFSDDEIKEIKQGLVPSTQNTCLSGVTYYVPNDRISKPWSIADSNNTLERLKELQQPKKQDESWKGDYDFYNPFTENNTSLKNSASLTSNTLSKVSSIRFERSPYLQPLTENLNVLRGVPMQFGTPDRAGNVYLDDIEKKAEKSANRMLAAIHPGVPNWYWPEGRKWTC